MLDFCCSKVRVQAGEFGHSVLFSSLAWKELLSRMLEPAVSQPSKGKFERQKVGSSLFIQEENHHESIKVKYLLHFVRKQHFVHHNASSQRGSIYVWKDKKKQSAKLFPCISNLFLKFQMIKLPAQTIFWCCKRKQEASLQFYRYLFRKVSFLSWKLILSLNISFWVSTLEASGLRKTQGGRNFRRSK